MNATTPGRYITRHHHITIGTGGSQEDYDFHTKVLGLKCVKKTMFYDGAVPIYHLYYGNDAGEESTLLTTFPMRHTGVKARKGSGQVSNVSLSVPTAALDYWRERLTAHGCTVTQDERFGERHLHFQHPAGIDYAMVGVDGDARTPRMGGPVPADLMIRGTHSVGVSTRDTELMEEFMQIGWGGKRESEDRNLVRYSLGKGGSGTYIDFEVQPERKPGTWIVGEGAIHHMAFQVASHEEQNALKFYLEGLGYTDVSDVKDRGYFDSIYIRTPSGALFEATVSHQPSFACDEPADHLGVDVMIAPQLAGQKAQLVAQLGSLQD